MAITLWVFVVSDKAPPYDADRTEATPWDTPTLQRPLREGRAGVGWLGGGGRKMRRALIEAGSFVVVSVLIAAGVLIVGSNMTSVPPLVPAYAGLRPGCRSTPVTGLDDSGLNGSARLCLADAGIHPVADVEGLTPGTGYVTWFGYFNRPELCLKTLCTVDDLRGERAEGVAGRMDRIATDGFRRAQFSGEFRDVRLRRGSQALIVVFERGAMPSEDARPAVRQLLTAQLPGLDLPETHAAVGAGRLVARANFDLR
jgi:hypothetical protein